MPFFFLSFLGIVKFKIVPIECIKTEIYIETYTLVVCLCTVTEGNVYRKWHALFQFHRNTL